MKILVCGDYCPIGRVDSLLTLENYSAIFNGFEKIVEKTDFAIVNLECPITKSNKKIRKTGPCLKTENLNALKALKYAGFKLLTLANNHILDFTEKGVIDTIASAKELGFDFVGAGNNRKEASMPLISEIKGIKIGFVNIAENEFCSATNSTPGANTFDFIENTNTIRNLKEKVDKIILIYHGGREHYHLPTPHQRKRLRYFIDLGVDAIIAHHTHCVSGYEFYNNKPIVYSLGNFIFDYKAKYQKGKWTEGMSVILNLNDVNSDFTLEFIPYTQGRKSNVTLQLICGKEKDLFLQNIDNLSCLIQDDNLFFEEWNKYLVTQERFYLPSLYVKNIFFRALFIKGVLPISLLLRKHNKLLYNLLNCETHYEISRDILKRKYERKAL